MSIGISSARQPFVPMVAQAPRLPLSPENSGVKGARAASAAEAGSGSSKADDDIRKAAESFEAIILRQLLASMRKAKLSEDVFGSSATDNFREMADARTADAMSNMRQFGIADLVERQLRGMGASGGISNSAETAVITNDKSRERIAE